MELATATLASAGIGAAASLLGAAGQNSAAAQAARASIRASQRFAQNAHQWTVSDMRKAGLNPILAAGHTNPAPSMPVAQVQNELEAAGNSARAGLRLAAELDNIREDTKLKKSNQALQNSQQNANDTQSALNLEQQMTAHLLGKYYQA